MSDTVRWGILGTGGIAHKFAKDLDTSRTGKLISVGSRTADSAAAFAGKYGAPHAHASYAALLDDAEVDAVYISLPNHLHAEWTVNCAQAGKHILCEKPFTVNHAEAVKALEEVKKHRVFFMEAFMYRCHPQTQKLAELIRSGAIGEVRLIQSNFCYNMGPKYENIRLSNPAAGGGIMDVGCYTISMARLVAQSEPIDLVGVAHIGPISRVDEWATASVMFSSGAGANLACATQVSADSEVRIWGSEGNIRVPNPWFPGPEDNKIVVQRAGHASCEDVLVRGGGALYAIEADTLAQYRNEPAAPHPCMTWDDTLGNMAALDMWRKSVGLVFDVERQ